MNTLRTIGLYSNAVLLLLLIGCKKIKPQPPKAEGFDPPIPAQLSYVAGPVTFQLADLERKINEALDPVLISQDSLHGKQKPVFPLRVVRTGSVRIRYMNNQVNFSAPIEVWLSNPLSLGKVKPPKRPFCALNVNFNSKLAVTPNWRLIANAKFGEYKWTQRPSIKLFGKNIPLAKLADDVLKSQRSRIEEAIDSAVYRELRLDRMAWPVWRDLQKPLKLNGEYGLWLLPKPVSIAAGTIHGDSVSITVPIRIAFETRTQLGERPTVQPTQLPQLQKQKEVAQTSELHVTSFVRYADINRVLAKKLEKKKINLVGGIIKIKKASVYGSQRGLVVQTEVGGIVKGTLFFRGRPTYDSTTNTLRVEKLDFDVSTEEKLLDSADWLLHDHLRDSLQAVVTIPLQDQIEQIPKKIMEAFERAKVGKKTDLSLPEFRFMPQRIAIRPDGIQVLINVESKVAVQVQDL